MKRVLILASLMSWALVPSALAAKVEPATTVSPAVVVEMPSTDNAPSPLEQDAAQPADAKSQVMTEEKPGDTSATPAGTLPAPGAEEISSQPVVETAPPRKAEPPTASTRPSKPVQDTFLIEPLGSNVFAAITKIGGRASSNAMFVIGEHYVVAVGAHMTKEVISDLTAEIASRTSKPVHYFVLAHHHPGYSHVDFDFPPSLDVIMAWQAWQQLNENIRKPEFPIIFFNEGMTIKPGGVTIVLSNLGRGHSAGDVVTYIPEAGVIFASDLFYVDSVGYMAGGFMREWILALEALEQLGADRIIPGTGPVSSIEEVSEFKEFFRDFLTEVIRHIERGDSLEQLLQTFDLPKYRHLSGYQLLLKANLRRAYEELKIEFGR